MPVTPIVPPLLREKPVDTVIPGWLIGSWFEVVGARRQRSATDPDLDRSAMYAAKADALEEVLDALAEHGLPVTNGDDQ